MPGKFYLNSFTPVAKGFSNQLATHEMLMSFEFRSLGATQVKLRPGGMKEVLDAVSNAVREGATIHSEL